MEVPSLISPERFPDPVYDPAQTGERTAVLAGGCFWCVEAVYRQLAGVHDVVNGYAGGDARTADYESVCGGQTDHAEAVEIRYDPAATSYGQLLRVFFSIAHDPTQRDRQGDDVGRQYRSVIFHADQTQREVAQRYLTQLEQGRVFDRPIVTEVVPLDRFYRAEDYHQDYAAKHPDQPYIRMVAAPKVEKLRRYYGDRLNGAARA